MMPYEKYFADPDEEETFKLLDELIIRNQSAGYTCYVKSFAFFTSDREIRTTKSPLLKMFEGISSVEQFEALKLPIKNITRSPDGTSNVAYEIDLSQSDRLMEIVKSRKYLDCLPILWVFSVPSHCTWTVKFQQRIACKFMVLKLIDSYKNSLQDNNIDMYNLALRGQVLKLPPSSSFPQLN